MSTAARKPKAPKPSWLKVKAPVGENYFRIKNMLKFLNLATVCQEAQCPNIGECWQGGTATFMLMGEVCTRGCRFCNVKTGNPKGKIDVDEPQKVGYAISQMGLEYVVITSVNRDDMEDQGAGHFAETIEVIRENDPNLIVEILTPDFRGRMDLVERVVQAKPHVFAHNIETVERLTPGVRDPRATYAQSLSVLEHVKKTDPKMYTKSSIMLGLGETDEEVLQAMKDLRIRFVLVTPGIRPRGASSDDQQRIVTPEQAIADGSNYLVVGRPVTRAEQPAQVLQEIDRAIRA